jgi:hypothetical protein
VITGTRRRRAQVLCQLYRCPEHGITWYVERGADIGEEIRPVWRCSQCDRIVEPLDAFELIPVDQLTPDNYTLDRPDLLIDDNPSLEDETRLLRTSNFQLPTSNS